MASVKDNGASVGAPAVGDGMSAFYTEVRVCAYIIALLPNVRWQISSIQDSLRTFNDNVNRISDLHSRSLNNMDDAASQRNTAQLDELVADTSALSATLKRRIKALEKQGGSGRDGQIRKQQVRFTSIVGLTRN
jgi:syntaxin 1B/2/3